jgi:assimilatory nitrate reductase electron transfer subunit
MTRLVVVGHGMVGSRLVEEVLALDTAGRFRVTVLGDEAGRPYNRVLLSEVVSGHRAIGSIELPTPDDARLDVRSDLAAVSVDREDRVVLDAHGGRHRYDRLVLATGAAARLPNLPGLDPSGATRGVHVLRGIDDARDLLAATLNARRAVVLGAGVLGLEAAAALAHRGLEVTVVHPHPALMERQLDPGASAVLTGTMERLGLRHRTDVRTTGVRVVDGRFAGLHLHDGSLAEADLLVVSTGTVPRTELAERAGLPVARGIVVGPDLASPADHRVLAVGDCAEPPEGASGLVAQGWRQARSAASVLTGTAPQATVDRTNASSPTSDVVRLKAPGLDVVAMGVCGSQREERPDRRHLWLSDPAAGRHVEVVVEHGRLVGATCVGAGTIATELVTTYTRRATVPEDPAFLLLPLLAGAEAERTGDVTTLPDDATVCRCNGVAKASVRAAIDAGADSVDAVAATTRATTGCGGCRDDVCALLAAAPRHGGAEPPFTPAKPDLITTETRGA